jgi:hypothetical protein
MAYPGNPSKGPAGFEKAPLSSEDFERLATSFRPSWELDEAPFTGAGSLSAADVRSLQGGGTRPEIRASVQAAINGSYAPAKPTLGQAEPSTKVIVEPAAAAAPPPPPPPPPPAADRPRVVASAGPWAASPAPPFLAPDAQAPVPSGARVPQSRVTTVRPPRPRAESEPVFQGARPKTGLWIGLGAGALAVLGGVVWLASSGGSGPEKAAAIPEPAAIAPEKTPSIPPPPPEPVAAAPRAQPAPAAPPVFAATALPQASPPAGAAPAHAVAMSPPAPHPAASPPPAPKPATASRPKGPTIVRDVPF